MASTELLPDLPKIGLVFPRSDITRDAFKWSKEHTTATVYNHAVRSAYFALIIAKKTPTFKDVDLELVVLSCVLHDLGWATTKSLVSDDKRFEVDGANIARDYIRDHAHGPENWDAARVQQVWYSIALHTEPSIAQHATPEVALTNLGIRTDLMPPGIPNGPPVTAEEYDAVVAAFPRPATFKEEFTQIMCGLCRDKPATTYHNFVGGFGREYGLDGQGKGKEEYAAAWKENQVVNFLSMGLNGIAAYEGHKDA